MKVTFVFAVSATCRQVGREGLLEELGKTREMILNQLQHPDSGVRPDTLLLLLAQHLDPLAGRWAEAERALAKEAGRSPDSLAADVLVDEVLLQTGTVATLLTTVDMLALAPRGPEAAALEALHGVAAALQQLRASFATIVMPEGLKSFLQEEASVVEVGRRVQELVASCGQSLEEVRQETELHTRSVVLGVDSPHLATVRLVADLQRRFQQQVALASAAEAMSTGQMLLCAANTLLDKVDAEMLVLRERVLECGPVAEDWGHKGLAGRAAEGGAFASPAVWDALTTTVFVMKLQLLRDFFQQCAAAGRAFQGEPVAGGGLPTGGSLGRPVRTFVASYMGLLLLGTGPRHLVCCIAGLATQAGPAAAAARLKQRQGEERVEVEELVQAVYDDKMSAGVLNQARATKAGTLAKSLAVAVSRWELFQQLDQALEVLQAAKQSNSLQHAGVQWYHEESLVTHRDLKLVEPVRHTFLSELRALAGRMAGLEAELAALCSDYSGLRATVDQRLKWAVGANPGLQEVADTFGAEQQALLEAVRRLGALVKTVTGTGEACLQFEALRTATAEARASDHQFLAMLAIARESCLAASEASNTAVGLSQEEIQLLDLNPPADRIDQFWIRQTEGLIAEHVRAVQDQTGGQNRRFAELARVIQDSGVGLKDICTVHHKLMADVAILLRTIHRMENFEFPAITVFLGRYKDYSELLGNLVRDVLSEDLTLEAGRGVVAGLEAVRLETGFVYSELVSIAAVARDEAAVQQMFKARRSEEEDGAREGRARDRQAGRQGAEEKNKFALSVLRRVRVKLEGREPDALRRATVGEQVDFVIREAQNQENLALMYEGWTAWI